MFQKVTVIDEGADGVWIAEVHSQTHAWILESSAVEVGNVHGIAEKRFVDGNAGPIQQQEMDLVNVEGMQFG